MTRLDRAFIKAYSKTTAAPESSDTLSESAGAATSHRSQPDPSHATRPSRPLDVELPSTLPGRSGDATRLDAEHATAQPHWISAPFSSVSTWEMASAAVPADATADEERPDSVLADSMLAEESLQADLVTAPETEQAVATATELPRAEAPTAAARADESSITYPDPVQTQPPSPASVPAESLRAAFEVDNLLWPEVNYSLAASCRSQWNQLIKELQQGSSEGQKVVLVTSHRRGEGRTSLVLCLAQLLSQKQQRVAIVDADFQRPQIARQLKLLPACGWDEIVRENQPLTEAWIESVSDHITLLPLTDRADADGLTGNPRLLRTLRSLREQHDLVLIDAGSLSDSNDRETLALLGGTAQVDAAIIVRDVRSTSWDTLHDSQKCLDAIGIGRWDVVENFAD